MAEAERLRQIGVALALVGMGIALLPLADQFDFWKAYAVPGGVALIPRWPYFFSRSFGDRPLKSC
jgi:hypothetical protein